MDRLHAIDKLVESLGFMVLANFRNPDCISLYDNGFMVWCVLVNGHEIVEFKHEFQLEHDLFTRISKFLIYGRPDGVRVDLVNLYLGCKSLEEAMIRKDLVA